MIIFATNALSRNDDPENASYCQRLQRVGFAPPDDRDDYPDDLVPSGRPDRCD